MTPADAVCDALAPLALAGYDATPSGLVQALADLGEAHALLTAWLDGDETCATLQRARAWVDARRGAPATSPSYREADVPPPRLTASDARCPRCGAGVKWSCEPDEGKVGHAYCQDGRMVSRRLPGIGEACGWPGARVVRCVDGDVVPDETDPRWSDLRQPTALPPPVERRNCLTCRFRSERDGVEYCDHPDDGRGALAAWVDCTHRVVGGWLRCPPDADGCPGWQPTAPPPSADYVGPGWADGVRRGA